MIVTPPVTRVAEQYLKKGLEGIEGQLQTRKWQDQSGQDCYSSEVVLQGFRGELTLLDRAGGTSAGDFASDGVRPDFGSAEPPKGPTVGGVRRSSADMDDEIPF